jgi:Zn ribbon nucleic-acid-binding protein
MSARRRRTMMQIKIERIVRCSECHSINIIRRVNLDNRLECLDCGHKEPEPEDTSFGETVYKSEPKGYTEF